MPKHRITIEGNIKTTWYEYSPEEIKKAWYLNGQGHEYAVARDKWCAIKKCDEKEAIELSEWFVHKQFACPTCCHYDGDTLSIDCSQAGSGAYELLRSVKLRFTLSEPDFNKQQSWLRNLKL